MENNRIIGDGFMAKRKPGRPRKHAKLDSNGQSLGPPSGITRREQPRQRHDDDDAMVGQTITGMVEATFEAGFLLSVKIGSSDSMFRGVIFKPGSCDHVTADNDVAPDVPMITRNGDMMHHQGSAKEGRKYRSREKRGAGVRSRTLVPVPIQPAPTRPKHLMVPVMPQPVNPQNGSAHIPVHHSTMQTESGSQLNGASNGKPFEMLLTQVMKEGQAHPTAQSVEAESDEQALSIEPLQAIHPVHPVHMPKPMPSYGQGKMTELLQAVQENVRESHFSQGQERRLHNWNIGRHDCVRLMSSGCKRLGSI